MTRQQQWAHAAYGAVKKRAEGAADVRKAYRSTALGAPILIRQSGLVQALAFWMTRSEAAAQEFTAELAATLGHRDATSLMSAAHTATLPAYLALTRDAIEVAMWFRRFAQSELKEE